MIQPGRELDALVAEKVMGKKGAYLERDILIKSDVPTYAVNIPRYSTNIAAAWEVVEQIKTDFDRIMFLEGRWYCEFSNQSESSESLPYAICLAALAAVGVKV